MSIINEAVLGTMYDESDAGKYQQRQKESYLTEGPGEYTLEVAKVKTGVSETKGATYIAFEFDVVTSESVEDRDGETHEPAHAPGDRVTMVKFLTNKFNTKEALDTIAAIVGTPPVLQVPEGKHAGKLLPTITNEVIAGVSEDDGERVVGTQVFCRVRPNTKTKGKYKGQTFYNPKFSPLNGFPSWSDLAEKGVDLEEMVAARFGK